MSNTTNAKAGLDALLTPDNSVLILIDHQPFQFAGLRSHDTQSVINNVASHDGGPGPRRLSAQAAPGRLSRAGADRPHLHQHVGRRSRRRMGQEDRQEENRDGGAVDRDLPRDAGGPRARRWLRGVHRDRRVGRRSLEAHEMAIQRMVQAGAVPITWTVFASELQRDWARTATVPAIAQMLVDHMGNVGTSLTWEQQLLATPSEAKSSAAAKTP